MMLNYSSTCNTCNGIVNLEISNQLDDAFERMAKAIYEGLDADQLYTDFYLELSNGFADQIKQSYKIDFDKAVYNSPDLATRQALVNNCFAFSGAKSYSQIQELQNMIINSKGDFKTFSDFKKAAQTINQEYNKNWLRTEYNNAVNSSISAAQYQRYIKDADLYPYLIYQTAGDSNVRPEHQRLDGIKLPINDPFWNTYYPPNAWGCRCDVNQDSSPRNITETETAKERAGEAVKSKLFKNNPGKSGIIFKNSHPYFKNVVGKIDELKAVDNYGLKSVNQIYADPNKLSKRLDEFATEDDFNEWWLKNSSTNKKFIINDQKQTIKLLANDELNKKVISSGAWKYAKELPVVIQAPDEVYKTDSATVYIKYYNNKPIVAVANQTKAVFNIELFYEAEPTAKVLDKIRKGILLFKK